MSASDKAKDLLDELGIATTSQIGRFLYPDAWDRGQPQGTQALLARMLSKGIISRVRCSELGWSSSREYSYCLKDRNFPGRKGGHQLLVNEALLDIQSNKDMEFLEISPEYKDRRDGSRPVSVNAENLDDGTTLIPDIRARFLDESRSQVIWMVECDMGSESIVRAKGGDLDRIVLNEEDNIRYSLNPSCLIYKVFTYRKFINDDVFAKYAEDGKIQAIQCLFMFRSKLREKRFRKAVLEYVGREQKFIWTCCFGDIDHPRDFWQKHIWTKAANEPEQFSIIGDESTIEADYFSF